LDDPTQLISSVKEHLRGVPRRGIGYGLLRHITPEPDTTENGEQLRALRGLPTPQVLFNYMGAVDGGAAAGEDSDDLLARQLPDELAGPSTGPEKGRARSHLLQIEASQTDDGRMVFEWYYSANMHHADTVQRLADGHVSALRELIGHCLNPDAGAFTPSDFPLARVDQQTLSGLERVAPQMTDVYPLAPMQQGMLFHVLQAPDGVGVYWAQGLYEFTGQVDAAKLRRAWQLVVDRHPALRTGFVWEGVPEPLQVVHANVTVPFEVHDWSGYDENEQRVRLDGLLESDRGLGFDLTEPPLLRVYVMNRGDGRWWMVWVLFQGLCDGWSLPVVLDEVHTAYDGLLRGAQLELPPVRPYRDFIQWLADQDPEVARDFWREYLAGFDAPTPLPVDRAAADHWAQDRRRLELTEGGTRALQALARRARVTLSTVIQAGWALLLSRYSGQRDVVFGLTVSGRPPQLSGMESMVGLFINTLPLRADVSPDETFIEWLRRLQDTQLEAQRFDFTSLSEIQKAAHVSPGTPLFDSVLVVGNYPQEQRPVTDEPDDPGQELGEVGGLDSIEQSNFPLMLAADLDRTLSIEAEFSTAAFDGTTVERLLGQLEVLFGAVAADPEMEVGRVPLQSADEGRRLLRLGDAAGASAAGPMPVVERVRLWAQMSPDVVAVVCGDERLTFAELWERSGRLAGVLAGQGVRAEVGVGVALGRSVDLVVAFVGVLRAGGVYVPLPAGYPAERLSLMAADGGVEVVITDGTRPDTEAAGRTVVRIDLLPESSAVDAVVDEDSAAYVAFTSGSTGVPKGVLVSHRGLAGYAAAWEETLAGLDDERGPMLSMSGVGFDVSVGDLTRGLCLGRGVVLLPETEGVSVETLHEVIARHRVGIAEIVPGVLLRELAAWAREAGCLDSLRVVISGTDVWRWDALVGAVGTVAPNAVPGNVYGVTEAAIDSLFMPLTDGAGADDSLVPVGRPLPGARALVLDEHMQPTAIGVPGELFIGGGGVARGYANRPELTAERFLADPFRPGERLYRTGDRARWNAVGNVEFLGRVDEQVKIRGFRIEPGEIEAALAEHPAVRDAIVVARDDGPGGKRLVAYLVPGSADADLDVAEAREFLRSRLPGYMVPAAFVVLDQGLPLTANGKVDRRALPAPEAVAEPAGEYLPPRTAAERALAEVWQQVLGLERVGVEDNFFELGGDSILSLQIVARARAAGLRVEIADVFARQTVAALAAVAREVD
ncbi:amino acid adenylation domain-containing protein, partial [Actinomadura darangshiensis]